MENQMIGACGIDCGSCEIRLAPTDPAAARVVIDWFRSQGWLSGDEGMEQIIMRNMICTGCFGDRDTHWSSDCWILACCVDRRSLDSCSACELFACEELIDWAKQNDRYADALDRLREMREARK